MAEETHGYRDLEHTADKAIEAWGRSLSELFATAAEGMFAENYDLAEIPRVQEWTVEVEGELLEDLLHAWLAELLWIWERDEAVPCEFEVGELTDAPWRLRAVARGGPVPEGVTYKGAAVKAVTYHQLRVWSDAEGRWRAHVVFDV
jgi:SHS2 domain-containing protein